MIKRIILENTGPIELFDYDFSEHNNRKKPLILVGENGSGKSIALSHIVNALLAAKQTVYDNVEVDKGKVYKTRSSGYIKNKAHYYFGKIEFQNGFNCVEFQLDRLKSDFENNLNFTSIHKEWNQINANEFSLFLNYFGSNNYETKLFLDQNTILYFPPNRYENPAWLNSPSIKNAEFVDEPKFTNKSNRQIICKSTMNFIKNWLLDVSFDSRVLERKQSTYIDEKAIIQIIHTTETYEGKNSNLINIINHFLNVLFQDESSYRIGIGDKNNRNISIIRNEELFVNDLNYLSTGEAIILSLFCSILRDYDKTNMQLNNTNDIKGIVIIDEIDLHLHTNLQYNLLPKLIYQFPNVQFIITTHSPLFIAGMENDFTTEGFDLINLPKCQKISSEFYSEFESVYKIIKHSKKFTTEINNAIKQSRKPILFVEGDYDVKYITRAAELLNKNIFLEKLEIKDSIGYGNIDKIWKHFDSKLSEITSQKIILLYDCDTNKSNANKSNIFKLLIPSNPQNPIAIGIENLFTKATINKAISYKSDLIDVTGPYEKTERGKKINIDEKFEVNKDEKKNLCEWICKNGTKDDFNGFLIIFDLIDNILNQ